MNDRSLPVSQHLTELRRRVTWSAASVLVTTGIAFAFHRQILRLLMEPAKRFESIPNQQPIFTDMTEFIGVATKTSLLVGIFAALPFVLFQVVLFVAPGLKTRERVYLYALLPTSLLVFLLGSAFGYLVLFPPAINFLLTFGSDVATPYIRLSSYVNLILSLLFWMGILFQTPLVLFFLSRIGVVNYRWLAGKRRIAVVVAFILGALITPTFDPVNQALVAVPIIVLYEVGIWLARLGGRRTTPAGALEAEAGRH